MRGTIRNCWFEVRFGVIAGWIVCFLAQFQAIAGDGISASVDIFTDHPVCEVEIQLASPEMESLRGQSRKYVRGNIHVLGEVMREVGIHLKGSRGSFRSLDDKPCFTLDFEKFVAGQRFRGLQKIHLNNSVEDSTFLREQLGSELFTAARVPVPLVAHALVTLNGRKLGLYVLTEGFTDSFLARHFERADGNLYDTDLGHDVDAKMKRHLGRSAADDQSDLQRLAAAAAEPDLRRRWDRLGQTLDVDQFLTFMAIEVMICHWDGYCLGRNNFRIYHNPSTQRSVFLASGMDQAFAKSDMPGQPSMAGLVARAIMEVPEGRQQYSARFRMLFQTVFVSERLSNRVNELLAKLRPWVKNSDFEQLRHEAGELCQQIAERELYLRKHLSEPELAVPEFNANVANITGWRIAGELGGGNMQEAENPEGNPAYRIVAGDKTSASWRTTVRLKRGRYRFQGKARAMGITPLPFGRNQGASLRVAGMMARSTELVGSTDWGPLGAVFEVSDPEEQVELICELRASAGEVWFDKDSLQLVRQP